MRLIGCFTSAAILSIGLFSATISVAYGAPVSPRGLGFTSKGEIRLPVALSMRGDVLAGNQVGSSGAPFLWRLSDPAPRHLPTPPQCTDAWLTAVSGDGHWAVGYCVSGDLTRSFRSSVQQFQFLDGKEPFSIPRAVSYDGSVIVGSWTKEAAQSIASAFYWTESIGLQEIFPSPHLQTGSDATGVSADGTTIVGISEELGAFKWARGTFPVALTLEGGIPLGISAVGDHIYGAVQESSFLERAFIFSNDAFSLLDSKPDLGRSTTPVGINAHGNLVVGNIRYGPITPSRPFIWASQNGIESLAEYYERIRSPISAEWTLSEISTVSSNGHWIAGIGVNPQGHIEGWVTSLLNGCSSDFFHDGILDTKDVEMFFKAWEAALEVADTNADGGIDGNDVEYFFDNLEAGCSNERVERRRAHLMAKHKADDAESSPRHRVLQVYRRHG